MITVKMDEETLLEMLMARVEYWTDDSDVQALYEQMYELYIDGGCFDGAELDIMQIVDNDYINWCSVISEGEEQYDEIKAIYDEQGLGDCSCEISGISFIEAAGNDCFLVRY